MKQALILFTRVPIAGKTKTRLQTALTPEQCAQAHSAFLQDVASSCLSPQQWDLLVFYGEEGPLMRIWQELPTAVATAERFLFTAGKNTWRKNGQGNYRYL